MRRGKVLTIVMGIGVAGLAQGCGENTTQKAHGDSGPIVESDNDATLPGGTAAGFRREFPNATMREFRKVTHADGTSHYEVLYQIKDEPAQKAEFDRNGRLLK